MLLRSGDGPELETRVARNRRGQNLRETDLRVPREVIRRALENRRELLSMNFEPLGATETRPDNSIADLELRSVVCVPLVRIRAGQNNATSVLVTGNETVGVLYMDSRVMAADLAGGNRELLQTLAIEASTVLENARLLQEEQSKHQMEEELRLARTIQQSLLPKSLPSDGWLRASGSSLASHEVGGDYYDVTRISSHCWSAVVVDVSGKGVSSALLASLFQGALITATEHPEAMGHRIERLNRFLLDRTGGEKYATVFYSLIHEDGRMYYINAAHCPPMVVRANGERCELEPSGMPVGLLETAEFAVDGAAPGGRRQDRDLQRRRDRGAESGDALFRQETPAGGCGSPRGRIVRRDSRCRSGSDCVVYRGRPAIRRHHPGRPGVLYNLATSLTQTNSQAPLPVSVRVKELRQIPPSANLISTR